MSLAPRQSRCSRRGPIKIIIEANKMNSDFYKKPPVLYASPSSVGPSYFSNAAARGCAVKTMLASLPAKGDGWYSILSLYTAFSRKEGVVNAGFLANKVLVGSAMCSMCRMPVLISSSTAFAGRPRENSFIPSECIWIYRGIAVL